VTDQAPQRLRLSRAAGFRLQEHSLALNGLPAISVARPTKWGNPFKVGDLHHVGPAYSGRSFLIEDAKMACQLFERHMFNLRSASELIAPLRGRNLACWCSLGEPCHADVLLKLANEGRMI
jgi:hypothetical protein